MHNIHFTRKEFECECGCGFDAMDYELVLMLEDSRAHFGSIYGKVKTEITGGNRCKAHNEEVQKKYVKNYISFSSVSQHIVAKGADHKIYYWLEDEKSWQQIDPNEVYDYYDKKYTNRAGVGKYNNRTHLDSRNYKARWKG